MTFRSIAWGIMMSKPSATYSIAAVSAGIFRHAVGCEQQHLAIVQHARRPCWPAPGSEDTELGVLMELEVGHGETEVYARVQA